MSNQRGTNSQSRPQNPLNPFGLTRQQTTIKQLSDEVAALRTDQQSLMESMREMVSLQRSVAVGNSSSNIPSNFVFSSSAGPPVPPGRRKHTYSRLRRSWRRLLQEKMGGKNKRLFEHHWPRSRSSWPTRTVRGRDGAPDQEIKLLRLNYGKPYMHEDNQSQLRPVNNYLLTHRQETGVPAEMTREKLVTRLANSFEYLRRQNHLIASSSGRAQAAREKARSRLHGRRRTKRKARTDTLGTRDIVRFADGSSLERTSENRAKIRELRLEPRADIEFAVQTLVHSPEVTEQERTPFGIRVVARPLYVPWRSRRLHAVVAMLDAEAKTARPYHVGECQAVYQLPPGFKLPSSVRRWMVSSEWQDAHPEACVDVSDNAGPFDFDSDDTFAQTSSKLA